MKKILEKLQKESFILNERVGILSERNRILKEIEKANLPPGVWSMIQDIICPKERSKYKQINGGAK